MDNVSHRSWVDVLPVLVVGLLPIAPPEHVHAAEEHRLQHMLVSTSRL
jgi:hypothetical protein